MKGIKVNEESSIFSSDEFSDIRAYFDDGLDDTIWCRDGWASIIRRCHDELFLKDPTYRISQIKEKFGSLRYYFTPSDMEKYREMGSVVLKYEIESENTCDICGQEGYIHKDGGYYRARCEEHANDKYFVSDPT
jgi:hypothetical protein